MINKFEVKKPLYPLIAIHLSIIILVIGLLLAKELYTLYFLGFVYLFFILIGYYKAALSVIPIAVIFLTIFLIPTYYVKNKELLSLVAPSNRILSLFIALIPTLSITSIDLIRSMRQLKISKKIILGFMIMFNFWPLLKSEINNVKMAMKTRAVSVLNPKIFYRAYLIPFIQRLISISEVISMSIETRGFSLKKTSDTIYKNPKIEFIDVFSIIFVAYLIALVIFL